MPRGLTPARRPRRASHAAAEHAAHEARVRHRPHVGVRRGGVRGERGRHVAALEADEGALVAPARRRPSARAAGSTGDVKGSGPGRLALAGTHKRARTGKKAAWSSPNGAEAAAHARTRAACVMARERAHLVAVVGRGEDCDAVAVVLHLVPLLLHLQLMTPLCDQIQVIRYL